MLRGIDAANHLVHDVCNLGAAKPGFGVYFVYFAESA